MSREIDARTREQIQIVLVGAIHEHAYQALTRTALMFYLPHQALGWFDPSQPESNTYPSLAEGKIEGRIPFYGDRLYLGDPHLFSPSFLARIARNVPQ
ncbi:hypothetical protein [Pajaroellobacter abortibovis]|uniref:Uncharacterized protein n=1 Tax=Pajaroellobacter abortibovis TaxID=1882918 RepID=A0A1L6MUT8_9BACT|nr:hypothetical protein [Pajaroellobacter abortibovis]APR99273.1 hypothetical protein BCY86_00230 [Pajaroellobacter abortibovis]